MTENGFSRVQTRVRGYVRKVPSRDSLAMSYDHPALRGTGESPGPENSAGMSQDVADFLAAMDAKLDMVLSLLNQKRLEDEFEAEVEVLELGGDGLRFAAPLEYDPGTPLEFALVLNQFPLRVASAVGVVAAGDGRPGHPADFTRIREADLEALVGFVFQEERARIRETKWTR